MANIEKTNGSPILAKSFKLDESFKLDCSQIYIGEWSDEKENIRFIDLFLIKKTIDNYYEVMVVTGPFKGNKYSNVYGGKEIWQDPINFKGYKIYRKYDEKSCPKHVIEIANFINSKEISSVYELGDRRHVHNLGLNGNMDNGIAKYAACEKALEREAARERTEFLFFKEK